MQSESIEATNSTSSDQDTQNSPIFPSQHGLTDHSRGATDPLLRGEAGSTPQLDTGEADEASVSSGSSWSSDTSSSGRLSNSGQSPTTSPLAARIEQHEKASNSKRKKQGKFAFQIVPSANSSRSDKSVDTLPNEILTHILSHLPPTSLSSMSLVSKRFHDLITSPHAWRIAFSRYFPGPDALDGNTNIIESDRGEDEHFRSERRSFSRVSALASWRSEYILRTRLLRSLSRGKPAQSQSQTHTGNGKSHATPPPAVTTYNSGLDYPVSHIHSSWGTGLNKKMPAFVHGASEQGVATSSDPSASKTGSWGFGDFQTFNHFADIYIGEAEYGLGPGDAVGMPNVMDVSQLYGKIYGEACPGGRVLFTSIGEQRGRWLSVKSSAQHALGIPEINMNENAICSVWIAKSDQILRTTNGLFGLLVGTSNGLLASYALGINPMNERRFEKGEPTAKWVLSPGVPITAIVVDENLNSRRRSYRRIWAAAINALGEVFYLTDLPVRCETRAKLNAQEVEHCAWQTGRTVQWNLLEATRRIAKLDPFETSNVDGSYSPRSSCDAIGLSTEQIAAETKEIEEFLCQKPKHFRKVCEGWDMRRQLLVDFGGDDGCTAGEAIIIINCGLHEENASSIRRFVRRKFKLKDDERDRQPAQKHSKPSLFVGGMTPEITPSASTPSPRSTSLSRCSSSDIDLTQPCRTEWHLSDFSFSNLKNLQITSTAIDDSIFASLTAFEDPLLTMSAGSSSASSISSPLFQNSQKSDTAEIPGQRSRFIAVGTTAGAIIMWDIRAGFPSASDVVNLLMPIRIIYTDSPQISCLALTSLYLVHGGNDGLVQAWDPLASTKSPIRTLNSRFSSRARRRLMQAQASDRGVGNNYYAAGTITLDRDPTVLRGMVTLGTHLRYWSYSSSAADQYKSSKRRPKHRSQRGSNASPGEQRFTHTGRGVLKDYIANEKLELEREKIERRKQNEHLSGRFGLGLLGPGASDDEILAYATMLSEEAYKSEEVKRRGSAASSSAVTEGSDQTVHDLSSSPTSAKPSITPSSPPSAEADPDVAEAIRRSLLDTSAPDVPSPPAGPVDVPIKFKGKGKSTPVPAAAASSHAHPSGSQTAASLGEREDRDFDFALQLSLAEEKSRKQQTALLDEEGFPALSPASSHPPSSSVGGGNENRKGKEKGKGKGKA